jgi:Ca2+-binding EF-hand superfamily protein|tara:strand:+ start:5162 stop:5479 length:318 start_codon:yes stop_codon:yes gene_type:complete
LTDSLHIYNEPLKSDYENLSRNDLEVMLHAFISNLLENDFEKLCNVIYRHDVDEIKFNCALELKNVDERAWSITHLVIDREMEKIKIREKYRSYKEGKNDKSLYN